LVLALLRPGADTGNDWRRAADAEAFKDHAGAAFL
jgi:hypothetical protein